MSEHEIKIVWKDNTAKVTLPPIADEDTKFLMLKASFDTIVGELAQLPAARLAKLYWPVNAK